MMQSPSEQIIARATETLSAVDGLGRQLSVRRLTALDRLRLFKVVGPVLSQNGPYLGMVSLAASVIAIDGVPVPTPATESQLEAIVTRLGDIGITIIAKLLSLDNLDNQQDTSLGN